MSQKNKSQSAEVSIKDTEYFQDLFGDNNLYLKEIESSLLIMQTALTNEFDGSHITKDDIVNNFEIILDRLKKVHENYDEIYDWVVNNI